MKVGRHTKYKIKYCKEVQDFMAQGYSKEAFAGDIGVSKKTIYNWKKHKEFLHALKRGEMKCQKWWEELGHEMVMNGGGNAPVWIFNMKNRFGWRDRHDFTSDDKPLMSPIPYLPSKDNE